MSGTIFYGPKNVQANEVRQYQSRIFENHNADIHKDKGLLGLTDMDPINGMFVCLC